MKRRPLNPAFGKKNVAASQENSDVSESLFRQARRSGQLNLSNRGLAHVPDKVWKINTALPPEAKNVSLDNTEDRWWDQVDLTKLILASNNLTQITAGIGNLPALVFLDIHDNNLASLPEEIGSLGSLKKLNLSHNKLSCLPSSMSCLVNLSSLKLEHNALTTLGDWLGQLAQLEEMDISNNSVGSLPSIGQLRRLRILNLSSNALETLPAESGQLQALEDLNISCNKIHQLPSAIGQMKSLKRLDCRQNQLTTMPILAHCVSLKELYLGNNKISRLDGSDFAGYTNLSVLDLRDNQITSVPDDIIVLEYLERLDLTNNDISGLPFGMGAMQHLNSLALNGNPLRMLRRDVIMRGTQAILNHLKSRIPAEEAPKDEPDAVVSSRPSVTLGSSSGTEIDMHTLNQSKTLNYSGQKLSSIPDEVIDAAATADVKTVDLSKNMLVQLPQRLLSLSGSLSDLNLGFNKLAVLPHEFCSFAKLAFLDLRNNQLSQLPDGLFALVSLREIIISFNRFSSLPSVLYSMSSIRIVLASDNQITAIDVDGLLRLPVLETLDLQNNDISQVPPELGNVTTLRSLQLGGNAFRNPRATILAKGTASLLDYLRDRIPV